MGLLILPLMVMFFIADQKFRQRFGLPRLIFHRNPKWKVPEGIGGGPSAPKGFAGRRARRRR